MNHALLVALPGKLGRDESRPYEEGLSPVSMESLSATSC
jgi:hypothetical protein